MTDLQMHTEYSLPKVEPKTGLSDAQGGGAPPDTVPLLVLVELILFFASSGRLQPQKREEPACLPVFGVGMTSLRSCLLC